MMEAVAAKMKAEEVKERKASKKAKKELPAPALAPSPEEPKKDTKKVVIPEGTLKKIGRKAREEAPPPPPPSKKTDKPRDERHLSEVSPKEIEVIEGHLSKIIDKDIKDFLESKDQIPWHTEMASAELLRREMEATRKRFEGKTVEEALLEIGEIPHYLVQRKAEWVEMPKEQIEAEIKIINSNLLLKLSEYYNNLNTSGDLRENEKFAAEAMKKRIWDEAIGDVSIDNLPLLPEELEQVSDTKIEVRDRATNVVSEMTPLEATNSQLAEWLYVQEDGPTSQKALKGSPFDTSAPVKNEFIYELKPKFDDQGFLDKVETSLSKQALLKRMFIRHARVPISMVKERAGVVEAAMVEAAAYMPPEFEQLKGYYKPEFKTMELGESQQLLIRLPPFDLLRTYQLYYLLRRKGKLDKKEEYLEEEMRRVLNKLKTVGILESIPVPRTKPPIEVSKDDFKNYLSWVDKVFDKLSDEDVKALAGRPDQEMLYKVITTGDGSEEEKIIFTSAIDELFDKVMSGDEFDKFVESPEGALYNKIYNRYHRKVV
jgi:hypothetical protein